MRRACMVLVIVIAALVSGCGPGASAVSKDHGSFTITQQDGGVSAQIAEINLTIEVRGVTHENIGGRHTTEFKSGQDKEWHYNRWDITAGQVHIVLERTGDGPISLRMDGKDCGTITKGDELLIDDQRNVLVNGVHRGAETSDHENR